MKPNLYWHADEDSERGSATFVVGAEEVTLDLSSFKAAWRIYRLLEKAYAAGEADARSAVRQQLMTLAGRLA